MRFAARRPLALLLSLLSASTTSYVSAQRSEAADKAKILHYINGAWTTLSRSMTDCKSLIDPKVTTPPVLYLPAGLATPPPVLRVQQQCKVEVHNLPRKIAHMGDVRVTDIPAEGLLYLPKPYVVPGGRFNEMYGWDSYFIVLGLVRDGDIDLARDTADNFVYEIQH